MSSENKELEDDKKLMKQIWMDIKGKIENPEIDFSEKEWQIYTIYDYKIKDYISRSANSFDELLKKISIKLSKSEILQNIIREFMETKKDFISDEHKKESIHGRIKIKNKIYLLQISKIISYTNFIFYKSTYIHFLIYYFELEKID